MKFLQLNTRSLNTSHHLIKAYVSQRNIQAISLSETFELKENPLTKAFAPPMSLPRPTSVHGGVAALCRLDTKFVHRPELVVQGLEAVWYETMANGTKFLVGNVYIPPSDLHALYLLDTVLSKIDSSIPLLILGDFNSRHLMWEHWHTKLPPKSTAFRMGSALLGICDTHSLVIANDGRYTRDLSDIKSAPDVTLYRGLKKVHWQVDHINRLNSDHLPIVIHIPEDSTFSESRWDLKKADWTAYRSNAEIVFKDFTERTADLNSHDTAKQLSIDYLKTADSSLKRKKITQHSKGYMTEELKILQKAARDAHKKYKWKSDTFNRKAYLEAVERYTTKFHKAQEEYERDLCESLSPSDPDLWTKISKIKGQSKPIIQPLKDDKGIYQFSDEEICKVLIKHHVSPPSELERDMVWYEEVNKKYTDIIFNESTMLQESHSCNIIYNADLVIQETSEAVRDLRSGSSPGPDTTLPIFIKKAGPTANQALHATYQKAFASGEYPDQWKQENRLFIPKQDKISYNVQNAYRGVAMTDVPGKGYEKILKTRLTSWIDSQFCWDPAQFAYRKNHSVTQAIMFFVLTVILGRQEGKETVTAFIDLQGAFDRVWREGIIYQLYEAGLRGRLLLAIASFLKDRRVRCLVNSFRSDWLCSLLGVPQGSVIAPILFLFFIRDLGLQLKCHMAFADDLTFSNSCHTISECILNTERDLKMVRKWCHRWGQYFHKTEVMFHSKSGTDTVITVMENGSTLKQVDTRKLLGVIIDKDLTFKDQIEYATAKAESALNAISTIMKSTKTELALMLAKSLATVHIERTFPAWCYTKANLNPIEQFYRRVLVRSTGAMSSTATADLEVFCNTPPCLVRLHEVVLLEYARTCRISGNHPLKQLLTKLLADEVFIKSSTRSPAHTTAHLLSISKLNLHQIEQVADVSLQQILDFKAPSTNFGPSLGAAGTRTESQIKKARDHTLQVLAGIPDGQPIAFTDGSALGNPGPCGAASVLYMAGMKSDPIELSKSISKSGTSYLGELWGIALTLDFMNEAVITPDRLDIFVDCTSAMASCSEIRPHVSHQSLIQHIQTESNLLAHRNCSITYHKVAAHVNIEPNERADKRAKTAAKLAANLPAQGSVTWQDCRQMIRGFVTRIWQRQWDRLGQQRLLHRCYGSVKYSRLRSGLTRRASSAKIRLLSGHNCLAEHLHRIKFKASPNCPCGSDRQDTDHVIMHCPSLLEQRIALVNDIDTAYVRNNVPPYKRSMSLLDIFAPQHDIKTNIEIDIAFSKFIKTFPFKV